MKMPIKEIAGKIFSFLIKAMNFLFCFTMGALSLYVFAVAATYFAGASGEIIPENLGNLFTAISLIASAAVFIFILGLALYIKITIPVEDLIYRDEKK
jgi:uncharacterized protein (UPF0254 family)